MALSAAFGAIRGHDHVLQWAWSTTDVLSFLACLLWLVCWILAVRAGG